MATTIADTKRITSDVLVRFKDLLSQCFHEDGTFNQEAYVGKGAFISYFNLITELTALMSQVDSNPYCVALVRGTVAHMQDSFSVVVDSQLTLINSK